MRTFRYALGLTGLLLLGLMPRAQAQELSSTGYTTDFDGENEESYWSGERFYDYVQEDGLMKLLFDKTATEVFWGSFTLPMQVDISAAPVMLIEAVTTRDVNFDVRLMDSTGAASTPIRRTIRSGVGGFFTYEYDFSDAASQVDLTKITAVEFIPNGYQLDGSRRTVIYTGEVHLNSFQIGDGAAATGLQFTAVKNQKTYTYGARKVAKALDLSAAVTDLQVSSDNQSLLPDDSLVVMREGDVAMISYAPVAGETGTAQVSFTVSDGTASKTQTFPVEVVGNMAPSVEVVSMIEVAAGVETMVDLRSVDDGNPNADQVVTITAASDNEAILPAPTVMSEDGNSSFVQGERNGMLVLNPVAGSMGVVQVTVELTDGSPDAMTETARIEVAVFSELNAPPMFDPIADQQVFVDLEHTIIVSGLTDGGDDSEELTFAVEAANGDVLSQDNIAVTQGGSGTATITYTPTGTGTTEVTVMVMDDGGATGVNNGDQSFSRTFDLTVLPEPVEGEVAVFDDANWFASEEGGTTWGIETIDGQETFRLTYTDAKPRWAGQGYNTVDELNLTEYPYVTFEAKVERASNTDLSTQFMFFFWDINDRYTNGAEGVGNMIVPSDGEWHRITLDYTGQFFNRGFDEVNDARIVQAFFHVAGGLQGSTSPWLAGNYYIRDLRLGEEVTELASSPTVRGTLDVVSNQLFSTDEESREITLTGIGSSSGVAVDVTIEANTNDQLGTLSLTAGDNADERKLTFTPAGVPGTTRVTLLVDGDGVDAPATRQFTIEVIDAAAVNQAVLTLDDDETKQTIRGFGGFYDRSGDLADEVVNDLGVSIIRVEIEPGFERVNDNDDPDVINFDAFDYRRVH
ncbi:MAG: hypothetical protein WBA12_12660, partial [Catalinimonas sp.]